MQNNKQTFKVGDIVVLRVDPSRKGPIIEVLPPVQGKNRYKVFHSPTEIREYLENQVSLDTTQKKDVITQDALKPEEFVARLNSLRLSHPQTDDLYSLHAARIRFIPFQFKPILRFLRSDRPRLLIADEVGVGKTIEAGLILRELQSRHELKNVLILCPKELVQKWKAEMRRFDEDFRPLSAETLKYCIDETQKDGIWPSQYSRSIVHIELLRRADYLEGTQGRKVKPGLYTLEPPPQFDLLIVDEAHHLRTPGSNTRELARFFCEISDAVVFLTATPIQLGSTNLYTLLHLLRPDLFIDETSFNEMILPNPNRRRELTQAEIQESIGNEPPVYQRFKRVPAKKWEQQENSVKHFLKEQYSGKCQICDYVFYKRNGEPYFEGLYLVPRTEAAWSDRLGNVLCLCANCCAKFEHGQVEADIILEQIINFKCSKEGGTGNAIIKLKLCDEEVNLKFSERHILDLQGILNAKL